MPAPVCLDAGASRRTLAQRISLAKLSFHLALLAFLRFFLGACLSLSLFFRLSLPPSFLLCFPLSPRPSLSLFLHFLLSTSFLLCKLLFDMALPALLCFHCRARLLLLLLLFFFFFPLTPSLLLLLCKALLFDVALLALLCFHCRARGFLGLLPSRTRGGQLLTPSTPLSLALALTRAPQTAPTPTLQT